jgi:hypothetical protein
LCNYSFDPEFRDSIAPFTVTRQLWRLRRLAIALTNTLMFDRAGIPKIALVVVTPNGQVHFPASGNRQIPRRDAIQSLYYSELASRPLDFPLRHGHHPLISITRSALEY